MPRDINVLIRNIPLEVDEVINMLAVLRNMKKWEIQRQAIIEYALNHQKDIEVLAKGRIPIGIRNEAIK